MKSFNALPLIWLGLCTVLPADWAQARVHQDTGAFLDEIAKDCSRERLTSYLTREQLKSLPEGTSALVIRHRLKCQDQVRWVYFDSHRVRTLAETLAVVVRSDGSLDEVRVLSFDEPEDYLPKPKWFGTFKDRKLGPALELHREIPMITGATLSARAATDSVRKTLKLHEVLPQ